MNTRKHAGWNTPMNEVTIQGERIVVPIRGGTSHADNVERDTEAEIQPPWPEFREPDHRYLEADKLQLMMTVGRNIQDTISARVQQSQKR